MWHGLTSMFNSTRVDNYDDDKESSRMQATAEMSDMRARCSPLGDGAWVVGLTIGSNIEIGSKRQSSRFHFVLDNSGSMGRNTAHAKECFADLVALANGPCSLITFDSSAQMLGKNLRSPEQVRAVKLPPQGQTNITAGLEMVLGLIAGCENDEVNNALDQRTHHVLVLLSDGKHNRGPPPHERLPALGSDMRNKFPNLRLSVVVVGVTANSDTSMAMQMKHSLETVPLPALEPIYFASTPSLMVEVLQQMHEALASLQGSISTVQAPEGTLFVRAVGEDGAHSLDILADPGEQAFLCLSSAPPSHFIVDGTSVSCTAPPLEAGDFDVDLAGLALQQLLDGLRIRRVALGADGIRIALQQLRVWIDALESMMTQQLAASKGIELCLARATPSQRLAQHKALRRTTQHAKELLNQLAEIEAHNSNDSGSQAAFLVGARSKYGSKALIRASAHGTADSAERLKEMVSNLSCIVPMMRKALREDLCEKLSYLDNNTRQQLHRRVLDSAPAGSAHAIAALRAGNVRADDLDSNAELAALFDNGAVAGPLFKLIGSDSHSYLSLCSAWEQLRDWCNASEDIAKCSNEYELLMCVGALGYPIDVQRRAATQMDPFAMEVTRVRACLADTASLLTALHSDQPIVPPEGGVAVEDLLVLIDPDVPRASRLAASSVLLKEAYSSVVLCRDLHMFTGNKMRVALHAHSFLAVVQPSVAKPVNKDLEAQLRRQYLGRAYQCGECGFGPIDHFACGDLEAHHGEDIGGAKINNACPRCDWFSEDLSDWPKWDGTLPKEMKENSGTENGLGASPMTAASIELALRICYSARAIWDLKPDGEAASLCNKLANWETLTAADGVDHPVQLLLALAVVDNMPSNALDFVPVLSLLNEVCARKARNDLRQSAGCDESAVMAAARQKVNSFLGISRSSAPQTRPLEESEPTHEAVMECCSSEYALNADSFNFKDWVRDALQTWAPAMAFVKRLRSALDVRKGGWQQLSKDMEKGPEAYADLVTSLQKPASSKESLRFVLGIERQAEAPRILATMAAQAFLHQSSQLRRCLADGGSLREPLGDVRDSSTLRGLCVELRMAIYEERVAEKMREWGRVGTSLTCQRARAVDLNEYSHMCGSHVHGLDKPTFWGLWRAAKGDKAKEFLSRANQGFVSKYGPK